MSSAASDLAVVAGDELEEAQELPLFTVLNTKG